MIYSPYLWYQKTFKTLTKHNFSFDIRNRSLSDVEDQSTFFACWWL